MALAAATAAVEAAPSLEEQEELERSVTLESRLDNLRFGEEMVMEADFGGIVEDLERFQKDSLVRKALDEGIDLRNYRESVEADLRQAEGVTVDTYVAEGSRVEDLYGRLQSCDAVLAEMQELLLGFQADLGGISSEITHLRQESMAMDVKLRNRREVEERLKAFLEKVVLPPDLATAITDGHINQAYIDYIMALDDKISYVTQRNAPENDSSMGLPPARTAVAHEVGPNLQKLRQRAVQRSREYLLGTIAQLRQPRTNVHMIQQEGLLRYGPLFQFLRSNTPDFAAEVHSAYVETMSKVVSSLFRSYLHSLQRYELEIANRHDIIVVEEQAMRSVFSSKVDLSKRSDAFVLGARDEILAQVEATPILVHVAAAEGQQFPFEAILRSVLKHLCDSFTSEFLFCIDFFGEMPGPLQDREAAGPDAGSTWREVYKRTLELIVETVENTLFHCFDAIGIVLCAKIVSVLRNVMRRRRVAALDSFFDSLNLLLWPRFRHIMDAHVQSMRSANARRLNDTGTSTHYSTRRYAELAASLQALHSSTARSHDEQAQHGDAMLTKDLVDLRREMTALLQRQADAQPSSRERCVFLINNYDACLTLFSNRGLGLGCADVAAFEALLKAQRDRFVEEELMEDFGRLIAFVQQSERQAQSSEGTLNLDEGAVAALVRDFAGSWQAAIKRINADVLAYFSNFVNGMEILKYTLAQLLIYYKRFQDLVSQQWPRRLPPFAKDLVDTELIFQEIRKYSRSF